MSAYALTPLARADIFNIWTFIAQDSEAAANRVEQAIFDACDFSLTIRCAAIPVANSHRIPFASGL